MNPAQGLFPMWQDSFHMQKTRQGQKHKTRAQKGLPAIFLVCQVARLFRRLGYRVHRRPATHDLGVDLLISKPGLDAIVQCKQWRHPVGPAVVRDLYGTLLHTGADVGILATTSTITRSAERFSAGKPLLLIDGSILSVLLKGF